MFILPIQNPCGKRKSLQSNAKKVVFLGLIARCAGVGGLRTMEYGRTIWSPERETPLHMINNAIYTRRPCLSRSHSHAPPTHVPNYQKRETLRITGAGCREHETRPQRDSALPEPYLGPRVSTASAHTLPPQCAPRPCLTKHLLAAPMPPPQCTFLCPSVHLARLLR